jgi:DNA repair exonuclease SbcCD ATPase subunit
MNKIKVRKKYPFAKYPGSLLQNDIGESLEKGVLVWDIETKASVFQPINNDYSFLKIHSSDLSKINLTKYVHIRYYTKEKFNDIEQKQIEKEIRDQVIEKGSKLLSYDFKQIYEDIPLSLDVDIDNIYDTNVQNALLLDYLKQLKIDQAIIDGVLELNNEANQEIKIKDFRNYFWEPETLKFTNFLSYGSNNEINFQKLRGVIGIFGKNTLGKSTLFDCLYYAIFGRSLRGTTEGELINYKQNHCTTDITVNANGIRYQIIRNIYKKPEGSVTSTVEINNLTHPDDDSCKGNKSDIKKFIENIFGSYDDFKNTSLSRQFDIQSIVEAGPSERAKILLRVLGLEIYNGLLKFVTPLYNDYYAKIRSFNKEHLLKNYSQYQQQIKDDTEKLNDNIKKYQSITASYKSFQNQIFENEKKIIKIDEIAINLIDENQKLENYKKLIEQNNIKIIKINDFKKIDISKEEENKKEIEKLTNEYDVIEKDISTINSQIRDYENKITKFNSSLKIATRDSEILNQQDWHRDTEVCQKCVFLKDAFEAEKLLPEIENNIKTFTFNNDELIKSLTKKIADKDVIKLDIKKLQISIQEIQQYKLVINQKKLLEQEIINYEALIQQIENKIAKFKENEESHKNNQLIQKEISNLQNLLKKSEEDKLMYENYINNLRVNLKLNGTKISEINDKFIEFDEIEKKYLIYETYYLAMHRDGLPKNIIMNYINIINSKVVNILKDVVNWNIKLEYQNDELNIVVQDSNGLEYEKTISGMQTSLIGLAIRSVLVLVSKISKCKILLLDECLGTLDDEMILEMPKVFDYLKGMFKNIIIISHIPIHDSCDHLIIIDREGDYSKITQR